MNCVISRGHYLPIPECAVGQSTCHSANEMDTVHVNKGPFALTFILIPNFHVWTLDTCLAVDFDFPDKVTGYLSQESGDFEFIGPDRDKVQIDTINKGIKFAKILLRQACLITGLQDIP